MTSERMTRAKTATADMPVAMAALAVLEADRGDDDNGQKEFGIASRTSTRPGE